MKVLTGARSSIILVSKDVTAELIWENEKDQKAKGSSSILNPTAPVKKGSGAARFDEIRFSKGTGVKIVNLQFSCMAKAPPSLEIPGAGGEFRLTSNLSQPFIVMTNESQFSDSAEKLLEQVERKRKSQVVFNRFVDRKRLESETQLLGCALPICFSCII